MPTYLFIALFLLYILRCSASIIAYTPNTLILLDCGASSSSNDRTSRTWVSDESSKYSPIQSPSSPSSSPSEIFPSASSPVQQVPYQTARVFKSQYSYVFHLPVGPQFVRLYFFPDSYSTYDARQSFFSVTANDHTLLGNFSAYLNAPPAPSASEFYREFVVNVEDNQILNLTFSPASGSFAFVNGIEVVSMPEGLYFKGDEVPIKSPDRLYYLKNSSALENLYRLNVGGSDVQIQDDTGMFRYWTKDDGCIYGADFGYHLSDETERIKYTADTPPYTAPEIVYQTYRVKANLSSSLEWSFSVDSGFYYLLRFHFCELQWEVTGQNQRVFTISVDNQTLEYQTDVFSMAGGKGIPIHRDYVVFVLDDGSRGKKDMILSLLPNVDSYSKYTNVLLNGLEIFKISDLKQSLAASNPAAGAKAASPPADPRKKNGSKRSSLAYAVIGSVIGVAAVLAALLGFLIVRRRKNRANKGHKTGTTKSSWVLPKIAMGSTTRTSRSSRGGSLPSDLCRHFSLEEIESATNGFDEAFLIGRGGFGNVYRGLIDDGTGTKAVAIKRLNPSSSQGAHEFLTEIEMLSRMRHVHLVSLIGYCNDDGEMILVYDYMARGTLREHLYRSDNVPLAWTQRLSICIGAAKGLDYLHTGAKLTVIHRDVKSTNILLDDKFVAKVSDFGLSKVGPTGGPDDTHVSTVVKGSLGYVDPEYYRRQQLTDKSDVYSFGVLLFEVLCGRPAIVTAGLPREQANLAEWAKLCHKKGTVGDIVDPNLKGQIALECLSKFVETAVLCLRDKGIERPAMSDVVWNLEFAMQLQESAEVRKGEKGLFVLSPSNHQPLLSGESEPIEEDEEIFTGSSENNADRSKSSSSFLSSPSNGKLTSREIFSEIKNPSGR